MSALAIYNALVETSDPASANSCPRSTVDTALEIYLWLTIGYGNFSHCT